MPIVGWLMAFVATALFIRERYKRKREFRERDEEQWPVRPIDLQEVDPIFTPGPHGPTIDTAVTFVGRGPMVVPGGTSDGEAWILSVLAKRARHLFEFGTCTGKTAWLWQRNACPDARIVTLTLAPEQNADYRSDKADNPVDVKYALKESRFNQFLYSGTDAESSIVQLYGDSKQFDESPYVNWADLVFVDGSHAYSYVVSDSAKALRIVRPGGLVLWHDYAGPNHAMGVFQALNELSTKLPLRHIKGTAFVVHRKPVS